MVLTAHQPSYLPWLGLLHKISLADMYVIYDDVQYKPKHTDNRNRIKTTNGVQWLTVPCYHKDHFNMRICDVQIIDGNWRRKHWRALELAYHKAPYWADHAEYFQSVYERPWRKLVDLNEEILSYLMRVFGISPSMGIYHGSIMRLKGTRADRVLYMCKRLCADVYIFGANGRKYLTEDDTAAFAAAGVRVVFQDYRHPGYIQLHGPFVSHLSAIDLLFNEGARSLDILLDGNCRDATELATR